MTLAQTYPQDVNEENEGEDAEGGAAVDVLGEGVPAGRRQRQPPGAEREPNTLRLATLA